MARFDRLTTLQAFYQTGMVPVFNHPDVEVAWKVVKACYAGGVRVFEFTNRGDFSDEVFGELVKRAVNELPDLILGAGTVLDAGTASIYLQKGANFIVMPYLSEEVARVCNKRMVPWAAGCATLTEISKAQELGAEIVKVFPGNILGPAFVKGALGPMPWSKLMPTGGVEPTEASLKEWFDAGVACVGIGSQLFPKNLNAMSEISDIKRKCALSIETIKAIRSAK